MAKSDSFFGLRRGSTKTLTFSVLKGKQITKDRVEGGRNPRTPEQMVQRMCMATASAAYAQMKQIVDHSFEGITYGQTTMSEFIRVNADALRQNYLAGEYKFAYNPYRDRLMYAGEYIMSRGSASPIISGFEFSQLSNRQQVLVCQNSDGNINADFVMKALGVEVGDMCTFITLTQRDTDASFVFNFFRLTFLKGGDVTLTPTNYAEYIKVESNNQRVSVTLDSRVGENPAKFRISYVVDDSIQGDAIYGCAIHSKKYAGKWLRSNASINVGNAELSPYAADALETYPVGPSYVLNGGTIEE